MPDRRAIGAASGEMPANASNGNVVSRPATVADIPVAF